MRVCVRAYVCVCVRAYVCVYVCILVETVGFYILKSVCHWSWIFEYFTFNINIYDGFKVKTIFE